MAGACITPPCLLQPSIPSAILLRKPLLLASALTTPRPRKFAKRKNYLRPKILKTTTKPYIKPQNETINPLETPIQHTHISPSDEDTKATENQALRLSEVLEPEAIGIDTESNFYETPIQQSHILDSDLDAGDELKTSEKQEFRLSEVSDPSEAGNAVADSKELSNQETAKMSNTLVEVMESGESRHIKSTTMMNRRKNSKRNGTSNMKEVKDQKVVNPKEGMKSGNDTDFWWFSLPYVLAIRMRRGYDDEGPEGLFTLKSSSQVNGSLSHTVAFEDRGDATNFCYLLQSFFEDLGDFSAEIVPLPVKELSEAIRSHTMKVIVVKKGKLKLYAGQPLADAEMALRSLVEQE